MWSDKPCKIWTGYKRGRGQYPYVWDGGKMVSLTRKLLEEKLGRPIKEDHFALHYCDTPACYEIEHLREGTKSQNSREASRKGRMKGTIGKGWHNG